MYIVLNNYKSIFMKHLYFLFSVLISSAALSQTTDTLDFNNVNVKAKTNEGLGDTGSGHAIAATAIALLRRRLKR